MGDRGRVTSGIVRWTALRRRLSAAEARAQLLVFAHALEVEDDGEQVQRERGGPEELAEAHGQHEQERVRDDDRHDHQAERDERHHRRDEDQPPDGELGDVEHGYSPFSFAATGPRPLPPWAKARGWTFSPPWQSTHFASP